MPDGTETRLQFKVGDDRAQVGVARPLADAVDRALHLPGPGAHGRQRIGHGAVGIVVAVDPQRRAGQMLSHGGGDLIDLLRQAAAVGLAQRDHIGPRLGGGGDDLERIGRVAFVAVKEMLGVEDDLQALFLQVGHRLGAQQDIFIERAPQDLGDMQVPGLANQGCGRGLALQDGRQRRVRLDRQVGPAGVAERGDPRVPQLPLADLLEKLHLLRIGDGVAALDVVDPEFVQTMGDQQLVGQGKTDPLGLHAVPKRRVVNRYPVHCYAHFIASYEDATIPRRPCQGNEKPRIDTENGTGHRGSIWNEGLTNDNRLWTIFFQG